MRSSPAIVSLTALLTLVSCGGGAVKVFNAAGQLAGTIRIDSADTFTVIDRYGQTQGHVRGGAVRDENGKRVATMTAKDDRMILADTNQNDIGTLERGTDCFGKTQQKLGHVEGQVDPQAAGAACILLLLPKDHPAAKQ